MTDPAGSRNDMFAPLNADEREAASSPGTQRDDGWRVLQPVPPDAPEPEFRHRRYGAPSGTWAYRDETGAILGYAVRFDPPTGRKQILPLTFCEAANGSRSWRWAGFPEPRPLYALDRLAARPNAPVLVVEGEKTADAAAALFPEYVAITSAGGASAAAKADWSPLVGRHLKVWPDQDEVGRDYAAQVSTLAIAAGATTVATVDLSSVFPEGWDLADAPPAGISDTDLHRLLEAAQPTETRTLGLATRLDPRGPFRLTGDGLYWVDPDDEDDRPPFFICSPLGILAETRDSESRTWGLLLQWHDRDGTLHPWAMPRSLLAGDGNELVSTLLDRGLRITPGRKARERLLTYLATARSDERIRSVARIGWHGSAFVLPDQTIGQGTGERVMLQTSGAVDHAFKVRGDLEGWQQSIARFATGNSRLAFALSVAFAAPLLHPTGVESGGFHLRGASSIGKSTALVVAGSAWGGGTLNGFLRQWRATDNGLEAVAATHCDVLLCLDELSQVDPRAAGQAAYMLSNGMGKARAGRGGESRTPSAWRVLFLSTGEISIADKLAEDSRAGRLAAGQQVRVVDLPADAGAGYGLFEELHGFPSADALARQLKTAASEHYGVAARMFLQRLIEYGDASINELNCERRSFVELHCPVGADGQVVRVAERFGLVAAAGELAVSLGVLPWHAGEAHRTAAACFEAWLEARGGIEAAEITAGIEQVLGFLRAHGSSRFEEWPLGAPVAVGGRTPNRVGWRRQDERSQWEYLVTTTGFQEMTRGLDSKRLARALIDRGLLVPDRHGKSSRSMNVPNHRRLRLYHFPASALAEPDEAEPDEDLWWTV